LLLQPTNFVDFFDHKHSKKQRIPTHTINHTGMPASSGAVETRFKEDIFKVGARKEYEMLAVKINDPWLEEHLAAVAREQGKSRTALVRDLVADYLEDLEDYAECERRMADLKAGRSRVYTSEEVERELDLAH
jgi:RHH-type rel operon transcriptional repressor/antitoxin RelB